jgi:uncharacterized membrane protein
MTSAMEDGPRREYTSVADEALPRSPEPGSAGTRASRVQAVDLLRGLVMVLMAIDHTRDFIHAPAMAFRPEDLPQTTVAIFMTRWITHFCAPVFMFCAGLGAFFRLNRGATKSELARFLLTRGLWLIVLEFTIVRAGFFFQIGVNPLILLVFWALGMSMVPLAALIYLPYRVLLALSVAMIVFHNLFDAVPAARFGQFAWLWQILHVQGVVAGSNPIVLVAYPLVPWIGVMTAGFCFGRVYRLPQDRRRSLLLALGLVLTIAFVGLRAINAYGDPAPWTTQRSAAYTVLSFLNTTKYPPSLLFLLMTLGPALLFLAWADRVHVGERNPLLVFGRVPLFYFVLHIPLIHAMAIGLTWLQYGSAPFLFMPPPTLGTPRNVFPPDYGWNLWTVYAVCAAAVFVLYPICLWFMRVKARRRSWWLSYL